MNILTYRVERDLSHLLDMASIQRRTRPFQINSNNQIVQMFKSFKSFQSLRYPNFVVTMRPDALIQLQHFFKVFLCFSLDLFSCIIVSHITTIVNPTKCERLIFLLRFTFERLCSRHSWRWVGRRRARELYQTSLFDYRSLFGLWILTRQIVNGVLR